MRLTTAQRGTLNANRDGISGTPGREEDYTLDELGNWSGYVTKTSGATDLDQTRVHDKANQIAASESGDPITETTGSPVWVDPVYDAAGNMTEGPSALDPTVHHKYVYDACNHLVQVKVSSGGSDTVIATYRHNALNWRTRKLVGSNPASPTTAYDYYYNRDWQLLKSFRTPSGGSTYAYKQFVWDPRYIDAPVCRFRDTDPDGSFDETLYYTHDAQYNVTALVETDGDVVERYMYDPYGQVTVLNGEDDNDGDEWTVDSDGGDWDNEILYCGYRHDPETGLYHVRNRYYHPTLGRWTTRDPIGYADGMNLYEYCSSSPLIYTDQSGLGCQILFNCKFVSKRDAGDDRYCYYDCVDHQRYSMGPGYGCPQMLDTEYVKQPLPPVGQLRVGHSYPIRDYATKRGNACKCKKRKNIEERYYITGLKLKRNCSKSACQQICSIIGGAARLLCDNDPEPVTRGACYAAATAAERLCDVGCVLCKKP